MGPLAIPKSYTPRDYKSLDKYFSEIDKIDRISVDEEIMLARQIRHGDQSALNRLTKCNLRFVVSVAKQYQFQGLTLGDLINEGNMGLITAAQRYDETRGFKFISYAVWWIRQSIVMAIAEHARLVRLPYKRLQDERALNRTYAKLEQEHGRMPSDEELAAHMNMPLWKLRKVISTSHRGVSIDEPLNGEEDFTLSDILPHDFPGTDQHLQQDDITKEIQYLLNSLKERDRQILSMYFGLGGNSQMTLEEIGKQLNITKEHAGRLKGNALNRLRNSSGASVLMDYIT